MASKMTKSVSASINGTLYIQDDKVFIEVEELNSPILLNDYVRDFIDKNVIINISYKEEF